MKTMVCAEHPTCTILECQHRTKHLFRPISCNAPCNEASEYYNSCVETMPDCYHLTGLWQRKARGEGWECRKRR